MLNVNVSYNKKRHLFECNQHEILEKIAEYFSIDIRDIELYSVKKGQRRKVTPHDITDLMVLEMVNKQTTGNQRTLRSFYDTEPSPISNLTDTVITKLKNNTPLSGEERKKLVEWLQTYSETLSKKRKIDEINSNGERAHKKIQVNFSTISTKDSFAQTDQINDPGGSQGGRSSDVRIHNKIKKLATCSNLNKVEVASLMEETYVDRRNFILLKQPPVSFVKDNYPLLFSLEEVKNEFCRIFYNEKWEEFLKNMHRYAPLILQKCLPGGREVSKGNLHQLQTGEFVIVRLKCTSNSVDTCTPEKNSESAKKNECNISSKSPRSFADSSSYGSSNSSVEDSQPSRCDYCMFTAAANRKGEAEELLVCRDCGAKAHPSCMEYTKLLYESFPQPQNWQCPECKTCVVCDETANSDDLLTCYICLKGYHMTCHEPAISSKPTGVWICSDCDTTTEHSKEKEKNKKFKSHHSGDEYEPPAVSVRDEFFKSIEHYPSAVPLAKRWTIENVESFLKFLGFEEEAPAFREQEIDGMSLLLMKRSDVLTGLGIKLGPALKIYKHIVKLQSRVAGN